MSSYGIKGLEDLTLNFNDLKTARDKYVKRLNGIYDNLLKNNKVTYIKGWGKFVGPHSIDVDGTVYTADHIIIATGSEPVEAEFEGHEFCINSDGFFELEELPERVILVGGGYIGTEIG